MAFDNLWFLNFVNINIEKFAGINFEIAVTEILYFWHPVLSCRLWTFWYFFSEIYESLINCNIVFWQIYKDIWKQLKTIIVTVVSIIVTVIYIVQYEHYCWINWIERTYIHSIFHWHLYRKTRIVPIDPSPPKLHKNTHTHTHTHRERERERERESCSYFYELLCLMVTFKLK